MRSLGMYLHLRCGRTSWRCTTWFRKHMRDGTVGAQRQASMAGDARRHKSVGGHGASHHQQHGAGDHGDVSFKEKWGLTYAFLSAAALPNTPPLSFLGRGL